MSWWNIYKTCQQCGERFKTYRDYGNAARYCSNKCRQKAYRERRKEALQSASGNRNGDSVTPPSRGA